MSIIPLLSRQVLGTCREDLLNVYYPTFVLLPVEIFCGVVTSVQHIEFVFWNYLCCV